MGHYSVSVLFSPPLVDLPKMGYNLSRQGITSLAPASQKSNSATTLTSSKAVILFIQLKVY